MHETVKVMLMDFMYWALMLFITAVSAVPAAMIATYVTLQYSLKRMVRDLPKVMADPEMRYQIQKAVDAYRASDQNDAYYKDMAQKLAPHIVAAIEPVLIDKLTQLGEQVLAGTKGVLGAYTKNLTKQLIGEDTDTGQRTGPLAGLGQLGTMAEQIKNALHGIQSVRQAPGAPVPQNKIYY